MRSTNLLAAALLAACAAAPAPLTAPDPAAYEQAIEVWRAGRAERLDFNKAYNPPCAVTDLATCPMPQPANRLKVRIEAGEKAYGEGH